LKKDRQQIWVNKNKHKLLNLSQPIWHLSKPLSFLKIPLTYLCQKLEMNLTFLQLF